MTCPSREHLSQWIDRSADDSKHAELKQHLSICSICRDEVNELVWLDRLGREAMRAIPVDTKRHTPADCSTSKSRHPTYILAKVAAVLFLFSFLLWELNREQETSNHNVSLVESKPEPLDTAPHVVVDKGTVIDGKSDAAFERWIMPYRQLRIPLIPIEDLASPIFSETPLIPGSISSDDEV